MRMKATVTINFNGNEQGVMRQTRNSRTTLMGLPTL